MGDLRVAQIYGVKKPGKQAAAWRWDHYYAALLRQGALDEVPAEYARRFGTPWLQDSALRAADYLVLLYEREFAQIQEWQDLLRGLGMTQAQRWIELIRLYRYITQREPVRIRDPYVVWTHYDECEIWLELKDNLTVQRLLEQYHPRAWRPRVRARAGRPGNQMRCSA